MAAHFMDSSAVVKRYVKESGSAWIISLFTAVPANDIVIVALMGVEVVAALTRRTRSGTITPVDAAAACTLFVSDLGVDYQVVAVTDNLLQQAMKLAQLHVLRGYDAVQLAAGVESNRFRIALGLTPLIFVSADRELNAAALAEGLAVDDPNVHP